MWSFLCMFPLGFQNGFPLGFPLGFPCHDFPIDSVGFFCQGRTNNSNSTPVKTRGESRGESFGASVCSFYFFHSLPIGSMYGIYANIGGILMVNVTIYSIHGSYGLVLCRYVQMYDVMICNVNPGWMSTPFTAVFHWEGTIEVSDEMIWNDYWRSTPLINVNHGLLIRGWHYISMMMYDVCVGMVQLPATLFAMILPGTTKNSTWDSHEYDASWL